MLKDMLGYQVKTIVYFSVMVILIIRDVLYRFLFDIIILRAFPLCIRLSLKSHQARI
jgi:hypothetical protein